MADTFFHELFKCYFIAFGVLLGGSLIGGIAAFATGKPLYTGISQISENLRIWAIVAAIGGTFDTLSSFERGFLQGETKDLFKQFLLILSAMGGTYTGKLIITWLTGEHIAP
ncbi:YtrH family sporulation protein [Bacillus xiapuensis]|uniref:YtrH family sporulation protein n=1 Tax=Bacillus xiapuensis TaxID=2014075 RepID=UPI000C243A4C|nr:YtrH family sporulation protein [Bacillus xiapuensis]